MKDRATHLLMLVSVLAVAGGARAAEPADGGAEERATLRTAPLTLSAQIELYAGLHRMPYDRMALPIGSYLLVETYTPRRNAGALGHLGLGVDPLGPDGEALLLGLEVFHTGAWDRIDVRGGRLNVVHGGRFRFVDGADATLHITDELALSAWGGAAWHPEGAVFFRNGPVWGVDLSYRSSRPLGGGVRYDHVTAEDGRWVERIGGDVSLHLPRAAGLVLDARVDAVPTHRLLELAALAVEVRPQHRMHLRLEGGVTEPAADSLGKGGAIYPLFVAGPTVYGDARLRLALPPGVLTIDVGGLGLGDGEGSMDGGVRGAVGGSAHPGRRWRHGFRVAGLHGPGGTATMLLVEGGRRFGVLDVTLQAEQALYRYRGDPWRGATHLGAQLAVDPTRSLRLALLGQLDVGRGPRPEGQLLLYATLRLVRGRAHRPNPMPDRFLTPWSPYHWERERMPRSPGTVPGADPYPSMPMGVEETDED